MTNLVKQHTPGADRLRSSYDDGCQGGIVARLDVTECPLWVMSGHSDPSKNKSRSALFNLPDDRALPAHGSCLLNRPLPSEAGVFLSVR